MRGRGGGKEGKLSKRGERLRGWARRLLTVGMGGEVRGGRARCEMGKEGEERRRGRRKRRGKSETGRKEKEGGEAIGRKGHEIRRAGRRG